MLGNCAMGRLKIVMAPISTMRMEITIATIGRLMKNFDMSGYLAFSSATSAAYGFGFTFKPWRTFCVPSATTRSPGFSPF
jgi:hypothetical protein